MKYAWIEDDKVRDVCHGDPAECYHPDVAVFYNTQVPDDVVNGDGWVNGQLVKPVVPQQQPMPITWSIDDIRKGLTLSERVKWDNEESAEIKTAKIELLIPQYRAKTAEVLDLLVSTNIISQSSANVILSKSDGVDTIPVV